MPVRRAYFVTGVKTVLNWRRDVTAVVLFISAYLAGGLCGVYYSAYSGGGFNVWRPVGGECWLAAKCGLRRGGGVT